MPAATLSQSFCINFRHTMPEKIQACRTSSREVPWPRQAVYRSRVTSARAGNAARYFLTVNHHLLPHTPAVQERENAHDKRKHKRVQCEAEKAPCPTLQDGRGCESEPEKAGTEPRSVLEPPGRDAVRWLALRVGPQHTECGADAATHEVRDRKASSGPAQLAQIGKGVTIRACYRGNR